MIQGSGAVAHGGMSVSPKSAMMVLVLVVGTLAAFLTWKIERTYGNDVLRLASELGVELRAGEPAIPFELPVDGGGTVTLAGLREHLVLLSFWASWCPTCIEELPALAKAQRQLAPYGVKVLAVSLDEDHSNAVEALARAGKHDITLAFDDGGELAAEYGTEKLPETYVIKDGRLYARFVSAQPWDSPPMLKFLRLLAPNFRRH